MIKKLHHVAILTSNMEAALDFYTDFLNCERSKVISVDKEDMKFKTVLLPIGKEGQTCLQIIEPSKGPGVEELEKNGEGTIFEIGYEAEDMDKLYEQLSEKGIKPANFAGVHIEDKYMVSSFGNKYFFIPKDKMRNTRTEVVQIMKK